MSKIRVDPDADFVCEAGGFEGCDRGFGVGKVGWGEDKVTPVEGAEPETVLNLLDRSSDRKLGTGMSYIVEHFERNVAFSHTFKEAGDGFIVVFSCEGCAEPKT